MGFFVYKKLNLKALPSIVLDSMKTSASLMVLVGFANLFGWILVTERLPQLISSELLGFSTNKYVILILINLLLLVVGSFMETIAAILILFPVLLNVATSVGIDPIQFSVIALLNLMIGLTTPPVGVCLFVASTIGKTPINQIISAGVPFLLVSVFILILVSLIPELSLMLPEILMD